MSSLEQLIKTTTDLAHGGVHIVIMSNGGFEGFHGKLINAIKKP
jgi:UDP-N-acetylmuramate-alanine ligase